MVIDPEVISRSSKKGARASRYFPKWAKYSLGGFGVLIFVSLIKTLLPLIGLTFLLAYIWSQSRAGRRY